MSLFQCDHCGCCENTALALQGCDMFSEDFDWSTAEAESGDKCCSACAPSRFVDGSATGLGKWHDEFDRVYLPKKTFFTNKQGNLEHIHSGKTSFKDYALDSEQRKSTELLNQSADSA